MAELNGGAIHFQCDSEFNCVLDISDGAGFWNNSAGVAGGALYWRDVEPNMTRENLTFEFNEAGKYGDDIACFSQRIIQISEE